MTKEPFVKWKISLPATLAARVENRMFDPVLQRPRYGERSELIAELLRQWLDGTLAQTSGDTDARST